MDSKKILERQVQRRQCSYVLTIPTSMIKVLKVKEGQNVRFYDHNDLVIIKAANKELTKKDLSEIEKFEKILDKMMEEDEPEQKKPEKHPKISDLEKLRIK